MESVQLEATVSTCPVRSWNEWDPLEEVIVGRLEGATIPSSHAMVTYDVPRTFAKLYPLFAGRHYPQILVRAAQRELDELIAILKGEGITVRRPEIVDFATRFGSPSWSSRGYCVTCPRDGVLIVGDQIIETPMAWRSRDFEVFAYRRLFKEYFEAGARWAAAPRPMLEDALYDSAYAPPGSGDPIRYVTTEEEPVFDAADFVRCGRDLFGIRSNTTNRLGMEWLRRHLGEEFRVHELPGLCRRPMHIDSTFMPLAPGRVLVNPVNIDPDALPSMFRRWEVLVAPTPDPIPRSEWRFLVSMCSPWISVNVLMLDPKRVIVERTQTSLVRALKEWGFDPIPCPFLSYAPFGGSFHCATLDVRRRGVLESYF